MAGILAVLVVVGLAGVASASEYPSVPDPNGKYIHCNILFAESTGTAGYRSMSCQYGPTTGRITALSSFTYDWSGFTQGSGSCLGISNGSPKTENGATWVSNATVNSGGLFQSKVSIGSSCSPGTGTQGTVSNLGSSVALTATVSNPAGGSAISNGAGSFDASSYGTFGDYPSYPSDFYPGGESGVNAPSPCVMATPASGTAEASIQVEFNASCTTGKTGATYAWTWPSSPANSGSESSGSVVHRTFTENGEATIILVVTNGNGATTLTFKYVVGATEGDVTDCGAWWHISFYLTTLFIPSSDAWSTAWGDLSDSVEGTYPLGPIIWGATFVKDGYDGFKVGINYTVGHPTSDCDYGATWDVNGGAAGGEVSVPVVPGTGSDASCTAEGTLDSYSAVADVLHPATTVLFYALGALALFRIASRTFGGSDEGGGDE